MSISISSDTEKHGGNDLHASSSRKIGDVVDLDAHKLQEMGYEQDMRRKYSVLSVLGVGFSLTNSWWAVSTAFVTGISSGGSALLVYGTILLFMVSIGVVVSLAELVSALPNAAGQSFWARELAPKAWSRQASYISGWLVWAGSIFACASVSSAVGSACVGCYALSHPDFTAEAWHTFVAYQVVNIFCSIFNCYGKVLPAVGQSCLYTSLVSFAVILITVPAKAETHTSPKFVFATFINSTGWSNDGMAFIVGLINANWGFSCLDTAVHLAEEIQQPEKMIPIAMLGVVGIGFVTSFAFILSMMFSVQSIDDFLAASVPSLELFYQGLQNKAGAIVLEALVISTGIGCLISCHTWSSRLVWSFSRDRGVPLHRLWAKVHPRLEVPLNAHMLNTAITAAVGCIYLGSSTAFNAMVTACIVFPYLSYSIPIAALLIRGRQNIRPGPFWTGRFGFVCNIVALCWILFTFVFYSFPVYRPATGGNMNYVSVIYGILFFIAITDWFTRGRKSYRASTLQHEDGGHSAVGL